MRIVYWCVTASWLMYLNMFVSARFVPRCSKEFGEQHPFDEQKEKEIYEMILDRAEIDPVVQELVGERYGRHRHREIKSIDKEVENGKNVTVPIIFHIFQPNQTTIPVPLAAIQANIKQLNNAFGALGNYSTSHNAGIRFNLQAVYQIVNEDYFTNCEDSNYVRKVKKDTGISPERFMNVFICDSTDMLGHSSFPFEYKEKSKYHGILLNYQVLPQVDGYEPRAEFNEGDTLIHESGHYFGLYHTFQGGCSDKGDGISDTPAQLMYNWGRMCDMDPPRDSCEDYPGVDPVNNFMDYTDDYCLNNFTPLQSARMRTMLFKYRPTLTKNQKRECVSGGNIGNTGSWKMCTSACFNKKTPDNMQPPTGGWCYVDGKKRKQWSDCCCVENGCTPNDNIYRS